MSKIVISFLMIIKLNTIKKDHKQIRQDIEKECYALKTLGQGGDRIETNSKIYIVMKIYYLNGLKQ